MIATESQGFSKDDAAIQRLCGLGGVSRAGYNRRLAPHRPHARMPICAISSIASRSPTAITAIGA